MIFAPPIRIRSCFPADQSLELFALYIARIYNSKLQIRVLWSQVIRFHSFALFYTNYRFSAKPSSVLQTPSFHNYTKNHLLSKDIHRTQIVRSHHSAKAARSLLPVFNEIVRRRPRAVPTAGGRFREQHRTPFFRLRLLRKNCGLRPSRRFKVKVFQLVTARVVQVVDHFQPLFRLSYTDFRMPKLVQKWLLRDSE